MDLRSLYEDWLSRITRRGRPLLVGLSVALLATIICQSPFQRNVPIYRVGDIAKKNIKTPETLRIIDEEQTDRKRQSVVEQIRPVYDVDSQAGIRAAERIAAAFEGMRRASSNQYDLQKTTFEKNLAIQLSDAEWRFLKYARFQETVQHVLQQYVQWGYDFWIVDPTSRPTQPSITLRDLHTGQEMDLEDEFFENKVVTLEDAQRWLKDEERRRAFVFEPQLLAVAKEVAPMAAKFLDINFVHNAIETKTRQDEMLLNVEPVWVEISEGEMIVREGQKVDRRAFLLLKGLQENIKSRQNLEDSFEFFILISLLIFLFYSIGQNNFKKFRLSLRDQLVIGGFFIGTLATLIGLDYLFQAARSVSFGIGPIIFLLPLSFSGMALRLFTSMEITLFFCMLLRVAVSWMLNDTFLGLITLVAALSGAARMRHITQRLDVFKAGLTAGAVQAVLGILGVSMEMIRISGFELTITGAFALIGYSIASGVLSSLIVLGIQPLIEYSGYTTDLRLMELSNTNHPLLRELILKAPGTYFHSFSVGQLAEKAAEAIHANGLFARVAALYHDIGKIKKPQYFIENIKGENKHDKLAPTMSSIIISNHVKDGIDLGFEHKLPSSIIEVIPQHHGTSLISYFYDKAKRQENEAVDEHDFRYPGPKPQTREAAIIMLADAAEATARSLNTKSEAQLREAVEKTIQRFFLDGQLDECELTLKDLTGIANAFMEVLTGVYHQRIDYPHLKEIISDGEGQPTSLLGKFNPNPN